MSPINVGVVFGSRSVEHEVSVITALQAIAALPRDRYRPVPLYIAKSGAWYTGDALLELERFRDVDALIAGATPVTLSPDPTRAGRLIGPDHGLGRFRAGRPGRFRDLAEIIDVALPLVHGSHGEDGTLQGLFELAGIAYAGCGVAAAAVSMDKPIAKAVLRGAGLPVLDDLTTTRARWRSHGTDIADEAVSRFGFPVYVKPASLGSSIGVSRVTDAAGLRAAIDLATTYDDRAIIEAAQEGAMEVNCSVLGRGDDLRASFCEQPGSGGLLSYEDKYMSKGGKSEGMQGSRHLIPAPLPDDVTAAVQALAMRAFRAIDAAGVARVDFFVRPDQGSITINELNTIPGSLAFYLWEPAGLSFPDLVDTLLQQAIARHGERTQNRFSIDSWLLRNAALGGVKARGHPAA